MRRSERHTGQDARRRNRILALRIAYAAGATSRADIARITGLTRASASDIVRDLTEDGFLAEVGTGESTGGKPPTLLEFQAGARSVVTLDLSTQPFRGAVLDLRGRFLTRRSLRTTGLTGDAAIERVTRLAARLVKDAPAPVVGIGVGAPGLIDAEGTAIRSTNVGWDGVPLARILGDATGHAAPVANDTSVAALAELAVRDEPSSNLMLVEISDGIGAGIVLDGAIHLGESAAAGEIGHYAAVPGGQPCSCGRLGCLETVASVPSIVRAAGVGSVDALTSGHAGSAAAVDAAAGHLGRILAAAVAVLDVHRIVLTGPLSRYDGDLAGTVRDAIAAQVLAQVGDLVTVSWTKVGADIVLAGAAIHVMRSELGLPW